MLGTYLSLAVILISSAIAGQALMAACGRREWSWLSPAIGLGIIGALAWAFTNLAGDALGGVGAVALATVAGILILRQEGVDWPAEGGGAATAVGALILGSIPFVVEMRYGILGTSLNPDMSQHLFAADRISTGGSERLVSEGYPLGPHSLAASVSEIGPSLVHSFGGLTLATAVAASLAPLSVLRDLSTSRRVFGALLVGFAYLAASQLIQGSFKELMQATFLLAFAIGLHELATNRLGGAEPAARWPRLAAVPLGVIAIGSVYAYSFPGLTWLAAALGIWAAVEVVRQRDLHLIRDALVPGGVAVALVAACVAPEVPRILDFASFETFDPDGAGLGNLFNPISPLESLGIWPSGDFRLDAGAGFAPSVAFYLGGVLGVVALGLGLAWSVENESFAVPSALAGAAILYVYAVVAGTPYQEAKALAIASPLAALVAVQGVMNYVPPLHQLRSATPRELVLPLAGGAFVAGAAVCSALALANGPVGPSSWTPALNEFREEELSDEVVLAVVDDGYIADNGLDLVAWELRGRELCVVGEREALGGAVANEAYGAVALVGELDGPLPVVGRLEQIAGDEQYKLYEAKLQGEPPDCPLIADGDRAEPG